MRAMKEVAPHQFGQMAHDRAISDVQIAPEPARGRKSWPHVLSPEGRGDHISGPYLLRYAQESAWREGRVPNGEQVQRVAKLAMGKSKSVDFTGYWQRHKTD